MILRENIRQALRAIEGHKVRAVLTLLIIAIGIMALVGILTAIDSLKASIESSFRFMGSNTFVISRKWEEIRVQGGRKTHKPAAAISYLQALEFKQRYAFPADVSISMQFDMLATVQYGSKKTNPNVVAWAVDDQFLEARGFQIATGRYFTLREMTEGSLVAVLGTDVVSKLFDSNENPIDKFVVLQGVRFRVIGVLASRGSSMILSSDRVVLIPVQTARQHFIGSDYSWQIAATVRDVAHLGLAIDEARGVLRSIRKLTAMEEDDFEIEKSDELANALFSQLAYVRLAAIVIGFVTLFGAAIGLMNIMLVSVVERTTEIGISKALGATQQMIRQQFLVEAITICLMGGILGIVLGIAIGNVVSLILGGDFVIPWVWIVSGLLLCFVVGLAAGIYPAAKAARLDPIEALRYE